MKLETVEYLIEDRVAFVSLDRPEKRNALNPDLVKDLKSVLQNLETNDDVKVVVLQGNGDAFCAGADLAVLQSLQTNTFEENIADSQNLMDLFRTIYQYPKPVIAKVHGAAIAGGCGLANVCDVVFAENEAKFGYTEVNIGFIPAIVSIFLIRKIGESKARELLLSGRIIDAHEAFSLGIVNYICQKEELEERVYKYAFNLTQRTSAQSQKLTKELMYLVQDLALDQALNRAAEYNAKARASSDCQKGIAAFLNKEKLVW